MRKVYAGRDSMEAHFVLQLLEREGDPSDGAGAFDMADLLSHVEGSA